MKRVTKFMAIALVIMMIFSFAMPTFATSTPAEGANKVDATNASAATVTVSTGNNGDTLYAYKVVNATIGADNTLNYEFTTAFNAFKAANDTYKDITEDDYLDKTKYPNDSDALKALLGAFTAYVRTENVTADYESTTIANGTATFSSVGLGQYIIVGVGNSQGALVYQTVTAEVVPIVENNTYKIYDSYAVAMKTTEPTMIKEILSGVVADGDTQSANIGDEIVYQLTASIPTYSQGATNTTYYLKDTLGTGLTLKSTVDNIVVKGYTGETDTTGTTLTKDTDYTVTIDGQTVYVDFTYANIKQYAKVTVDYTAALNDTAVLGKTTGNGNSANLVWSNSPFNGTTSVTHPIDTNGYAKATDIETVYTYGLTINKFEKGDESIKLEGAEFDIYADAGLTTKVGSLTTNNTGLDSVKGLASGTYYLKETKAPAGYKIATEPIAVTVSKDSPTLDTEGYVVVKVENTKGGTLPVTGGIGTVIFTVVGLILIIGATVVLIAKFRMRNID